MYTRHPQTNMPPLNRLEALLRERSAAVLVSPSNAEILLWFQIK